MKLGVAGKLLFILAVLAAALRPGFRKSRTSQAAPHGPRRLWMINHYAVTPEMSGGTRHHELATILKDHGWETTIFATPYSHQEARFQRPVALRRPIVRRNEAGVEFTWLYTAPYRSNDWRRYVNMVSFLVTSVWAGVRQPAPDAVIGSSPHLFGGLAGWVVAKWHQVPFVLEVRDLWPDTLIDMGLSSPLVIAPLQWIERFLYREAVAIVALAESIRDGIVGKGVRAEKVTFIPNAMMGRPTPEGASREPKREELGWTNRTVFIYAGAHGAANALDQLVAAAGLLEHRSEILIALLGDGPEKPELRRQAEGLENVVFLDPVAKSEVQSILNAADVGMITLKKSRVFEGVRPNKLFDYLAAGLPIVTNVPGETWGVVKAAEAGRFAEPGDPQALAEAMLALASNETARDQMAESARTYFETIPTREQTAATLSALLEQSSKAHMQTMTPGRAMAT